MVYLSAEFCKPTAVHGVIRLITALSYLIALKGDIHGFSKTAEISFKQARIKKMLLLTIFFLGGEMDGIQHVPSIAVDDVCDRHEQPCVSSL